MTTQIVEFKCPSCGHKLSEEEYWHVCQVQKGQIEQIVENEVTQRTNLVEQRYTIKIQRLEEEREREKREREDHIQIAASKIVNEEKIRMEKLYYEKEKQLEIKHAENTRVVDEKIIRIEAGFRQKEKESELKISRIVSINKELGDKVEKLEKALNNVPPELRGSAGELVLQEELQKEFKTDEFIPKKVGVSMADVVQKIVTAKGEKIPTPIVYDNKMASDVTAADIVKAKKYRIIHNTDYSIIVTKDIKGKGFTEERDGILLVHPLALLDTTRRIRTFVIWTFHQTKISSGKVLKDKKLYELLTSAEYNRDMQRKIEARLKLEGLQTNEENYHSTMWKKRTELLREVLDVDSKYAAIIRDIVEEDQARYKEDPIT